MKKQFTSIMLCGLCATWLAACQPAAPAPTATVEATAAPTEIPEPWELLVSVQAPPLIQLAGFYDSQFGITIADDSQERYTEDGGVTWQNSKISALQLFGLDLVDRTTAWACGNGIVRVTTDGAKTWQEGANFGAAVPDHCRFLSFLDAETGWAATSKTMVSTSDGAAAWTPVSVPENALPIGAISLYSAGEGCLLSSWGLLFCTADNGQTWKQAGELPLGDIRIPEQNPPVAAIRFTDADHGIAVVPYAGGGSARVTAFHTSDGGATWTQETVADVFGFPVLGHDGRTLTLYAMPSKILVYRYTVGE